MSHFTSSSLREIWLPELPPWLTVMATLPPDTGRPERHGLYVARSRAGTPPADIVDGVPVLTPELTLGQLAEDLGLIDLVVALDCALHQAMCDELDVMSAIRSRQRGLPMLRRALKLCDRRSESPWETFLRPIPTTVGIPVTPQELIEDQYGRIIARADLRIVGTRRLPEYDGADHRNRSQHQDDLMREKSLARLDLERYGYIAKKIVTSQDRSSPTPRTLSGGGTTLCGCTRGRLSPMSRASPPLAGAGCSTDSTGSTNLCEVGATRTA